MTQTVRNECRAVVVGDPDDPHVIAVLKGLPACATSVINAGSLESVIVELTPEKTILRSLAGDEVAVRGGGSCRGCDIPTVWTALGFKSENTFLRGTKLAYFRQIDYQSAQARPTSRRGATFTGMKGPIVEVDLNDPVAVGEGVLSALAAAHG